MAPIAARAHAVKLHRDPPRTLWKRVGALKGARNGRRLRWQIRLARRIAGARADGVENARKHRRFHLPVAAEPIIV